MDLTERGSVGAGGQLILERWGRVDLLIHNGRYIGPGLMDVFMDTPLDAYGKFFEAHCIAPIILTRMFLPGMLERGSGQVVTISSRAGYSAPTGPVGQGGWGLGYAVGKASGHMLAGVLDAEFKDRGVRAFNVDPGFTATERNEISLRDYGREPVGAAPPAAIAAVVRWLATAEEGAAFAGQTIQAQPFCLERNLYPAWK